MQRLEIFGDSILKGVIYSAEDNKYKLCKDNKYRSLGAVGIEVENRSKMGATISQGVNSLNRNVNLICKDTTVLFEFGGNDCDYNWKEISNNPNGFFTPNTPESEFISKYTDAVKIAKSKGARVIVSTLIPIDAQKYMNWITRGLDYKNILAWLGDISMLYRWQEHYNKLVERVCLNCNCDMLDLRSLFLQDHSYSQLIGADGIHPTQCGHDIINRAIYEFMDTHAA